MSTSSTASQQPPLHLHTYFRSSCSGRLRIALRLKQLPFTTTAVHLLKNEQSAADYKSLNPSGTVPTLTHTYTTTGDNGGIRKTVTITQSTAALEYLDEAFPSSTPALFPKGSTPDAIEQRAHVRTLVAIIACDTQPLTNSKPIKAVNEMGQDGQAWARDWTVRGLDAFEGYLARTMVEAGQGKWCVGTGVTAADVCLVPAV
ncbi:Maleylacetoacetate isomerase protein [Lasiodiplodia theobromae]|uniref:Maleylacetoacetate isomerase protein n=1 Tax=Lasiodiplodia theobromae TaxID=45133 RepID=UPI0015C3C433|nr:Maleylacetoacetate isomerase protein [Lasiodiplodia theobromae]KAF4541085.1 Maleylacetoacetate isomerase protein [Lasiodiplodia theobromae]